MEIMDMQGALEAVERLQTRLKERGEVPTQEKLSLLKSVLESPLFHHILAMQQEQQELSPKGRGITKSLSLNNGPCQGMTKGLEALTHSDSYMSAVENRRPSSARDIHKDSSISSLSSQDLTCPDFYPDNGAPVESQYCTPPRISRTLSMGRNLAAIAHERRHIEMIDLINEGEGLGFGIIGGKSTGVMVKTIVPGGVAGQDKRLRSGDHILQIGDTDLGGMNSEQVAQVLRNAGSKVQLLIARDVVKDSHLSSSILSQDSKDSQTSDTDDDYEFSVQFTKNTLGLGFGITSYIGDLNSEYSAGVMVKSIVKGSAVDQDGHIHIGDIILTVDGVSLQGCSEQRAMEVLRRTESTVRLRLLRKAVHLSHILPPAPPLQRFRHSHSLGSLGRLNSIQETGLRSLCEMARRAAYASRRPRHNTSNGVKLTPAEEEDVRKRWQRAVGPRYKVVVCQLERVSETSGLGISLEARAGRHYLFSVLPEGTVGQSGKIFAGDEMLEVNGIPLIGETHKEVVDILKELPVYLCMVCSRFIPPALPDSDAEEGEGGRLTLKELLAEFNEKLDRGCVIPCPTEGDITKRGVALASMSSPLAMWERESQVVELEKVESGLGFSVLDYQDPEDASKTVLVIRSLVPGGVAARDGRLLPGDRLVQVNDTNLDGSSLDYAVHVLKSTCQGPVRIAVAKPLPLGPCGDAIPISERDTRASCDANDGRVPVSLLAEAGEANANTTASNSDHNIITQQQSDPLTEEPLCQRRGAMEGSDKQQAAPPLPRPLRTSFEKTITVVRGNRSLGMSVCAIKDGSAMLVRSVVQGGCVSQDGRLGVGDSILAINAEPTSNLNNTRARAMLRRHSVMGPEISITYVSAHQVEEHRARLGLAPLASITVDSASLSPIPPTPSPEPPTKSPSPVRSPVASRLTSSPAPATVSTASRLTTSPGPVTVASASLLTTSPGPVRSTAASRLTTSAAPVTVSAASRLTSSPGPVRSTAASRLNTSPAPATVSAASRLTSSPGPVRSTAASRLTTSPGPVISPAASRLTTSPAPATVSAASRLTSSPGPVRSTAASHLTSSPAPATVEAGVKPSDLFKSKTQLREPVKEPTSKVSTATAISDTSCRILKPPSEKEKRGTGQDGGRGQNRADLNIPKVEIKVEDGKEVENEVEELHSPSSLSWGKPRSVQLRRAAGQSLGISIMGGRRMGSRLHSGEMMRGVFIKHISPDSPAAQNGTLRTGDRILEVGGVDLREASHEQAVEAIRTAGDIIHFLVQTGPDRPQSPVRPNHERLTPSPNPDSQRSKEAELLSGLFLSLSPTNPFTPTPFKVPPPTANRRDQRSPVTSPITVGADDDDDEIGRKKMLQRYGSLAGKLHMFEIKKGPHAHGLGLSLVGNKDGSRARMSVFVAGIEPSGAAGLDGRIQVGDELLEINGQVLYGRSHQNATTIINNAPSKVKIILIRNEATLSQMAQRPREECADPVNSQTDSTVDGCPLKDIQHILLPQDQVDLGICLADDNSRKGVVVRSLTQHGTASKDGRIKVGDRIIAVGDEPVAGLSVDKVSSMLRKQRGSVKLSISRCSRPVSSSSPFHPAPPPSRPASLPASSSNPGAISTSSSSLSLPMSSSHSSINTIGRSDWPGSCAGSPDPQCCPIVAGGETSIEISKGNTGLGLSIVGGCDTLLGAVIIHEVNDGGAAQRDGRLQAGDQILEVNGIDLRQATHEEAIGVLRLTTQRVHLRVFRHQETYREEDLWDVFNIELQPRPGKALGLTTIGKSNDTGVFVSDIIKGGLAEADGRLLLGDQILSISGEDVRAATQEHAEKLLQRCSGAVNLEVARFKAGIPYSHWSQSEDSDCSTLTPSSGCDTSSSHQREIDCKYGNYVSEEYRETRKVVLQKGPCDWLGIGVAGGVGSPHGDVPLFIVSMDTDGLAAKTKKLQNGDRIISINDVSTDGMTHVHAGALLKNATGPITLQVAAGTGGCGGQDHSGIHTSSSGIGIHNNLCARMYKTITLERGSSGLGFSIVGGFGSPHGDLPIYIKSIFNKGAAIEDGRLQRGDQIIAVNGHCLEGVNHSEAVDILKRTKGTVVLTVLS